MAPKTVLITGANRGIGLALAEHYKTEGWNVITCARNVDSADKLKSLSPWKIVQLDTSSEASITEAAASMASVPIDLVINNAGAIGGGSINETTKEDLMHHFEVNVVGPFLVTRAFLPTLKQAAKESGSALVCQMSSIMSSITLNTSDAFTPGSYYGYRASKTAINMINKSFAVDLMGDNIGCLVLHPGYVATAKYAGTVTVAESVAGLTKIISNATLADSGKLIEYEGQEMPW